MQLHAMSFLPAHPTVLAFLTQPRRRNYVHDRRTRGGTLTLHETCRCRGSNAAEVANTRCGDVTDLIALTAPAPHRWWSYSYGQAAPYKFNGCRAIVAAFYHRIIISIARSVAGLFVGYLPRAHSCMLEEQMDVGAAVPAGRQVNFGLQVG